MVRVLLFGATGFVGNAVALALRRHGHQVYALARKEEQTITLSKQELIPVLGEISDTDSWLPVLDLVDVVIDASPSYGGISEGLVKAIKGSSRVKNAKKTDPKLGFVYVSGIWVHGESTEWTNDRVVAGTDQAVKPATIVSWRPAFENSLLEKETRDVLDVVILRAGIVFGGSGSLFAAWWAPFVEALKTGKDKEEITITGKSDTALSLIHRDDFAEAVLKTVEKLETISQISYPLFDIVGGIETLGDINAAAAKALGITGSIKYQAPADPFSEAMSTSQRITSTRAETYLDFKPRHTSLVKDADVYARAFLYTTDYYSVVTGGK